MQPESLRVDGFEELDEERSSDVWRRPKAPSDYMSRVSHEARNLLAALMSNADWLRDTIAPDQASEPVLESLRDMQTCCERITGLLEDALLASRPEGMRPRRGLVTVGGLLSGVLRRCHGRLEASEVRLEVSGNQHTALLVDPFLVGRALERLVDRSLQRSPHGSAFVLQCETEDDMAVISLCQTDSLDGAIAPRASGIEPEASEADFEFCDAVVQAHAGSACYEPCGSELWVLRFPTFSGRRATR